MVTPYDIKLVFVQKITFVGYLGKSTKTAATSAALFDSNMHRIVCRLGFPPCKPTGGADCAPPDPRTVFMGPTSKG